MNLTEAQKVARIDELNKRYGGECYSLSDYLEGTVLLCGPWAGIRPFLDGVDIEDAISENEIYFENIDE